MAKFQAIATVLWEIDSDKEFPDGVSEDARKFFSGIFKPPVGLDVRVTIKADRLKTVQQNVILGVFKPEDVFPYITRRKEKRIYTVDGREYEVRMNSHRYFVFHHNRHCVCCGIEGTKMILEMHPGHESPHFNLYAEDQDGKLVMMTKDHIHAKSCGGADQYSNYQTMCSVCNNLKAAAKITLDGLKELRRIYDENKLTISRKKLAQLIDESRKKLSVQKKDQPRRLGKLKLLAAKKSGHKRVTPTVDLNVWREADGTLVGRSVYEAAQEDAVMVACIKRGVDQPVEGFEKGRVAISLGDGKIVYVYQGYLEGKEEPKAIAC